MIATPVFLASRKLWKDRQKLKITQTCQLESRPSPQYPKSGRSLLVPAPVRRLCLLTQALSKRLNTRHPKRRKVKLDSAIFINVKVTRLVNAKPSVTKHLKNVQTLSSSLDSVLNVFQRIVEQFPVKRT